MESDQQGRRFMVIAEPVLAEDDKFGWECDNAGAKMDGADP